MLFTLILFVVILTLLVLIHEAGHYITAKKFGIKVEEFGFGFPPRAFGIKRGETIYSINWLPIGGFVKLYGEDEAGSGKIGIKNKEVHIKDEERAFFSKPAWQRAVVAVAGVVMNFILAAIIFYAMFMLNGFKTQVPLFGQYNFSLTHQTNIQGVVISSIEAKSPAAKSGITTPSNVISVDAERITNVQSFIAYINSHKGEKIHLSLFNMTTMKEYAVDVVPRVKTTPKEGALGVGISTIATPIAILSYDTPIEKLFSGISFTGDISLYTLDTFGGLIAHSVQEHNIAPVSSNISGPVGVYTVFNDVTTQVPGLLNKVISLLFLAGLISISLAIMNVLPIPALDGGRLFFVLIELIFRRKVSPVVEGYVHTVGFAALMLLMVLVTVNDIGKLIH